MSTAQPRMISKNLDDPDAFRDLGHGTGSFVPSGVSRALAAGTGLQFMSTGTHALKGLDEPMELFEVHEAS